MDIGNLICGFSAFSKSSLNIRKFSVYVLSKPRLENFEHYFASVWDECNCVVVWAFFGSAFLWDWNENWHFSSPVATAEFSKFAGMLSAATSPPEPIPSWLGSARPAFHGHSCCHTRAHRWQHCIPKPLRSPFSYLRTVVKSFMSWIALIFTFSCFPSIFLPGLWVRTRNVPALSACLLESGQMHCCRRATP